MNIILTVVISIVLAIFAWVLLAMLMMAYTIVMEALWQRKYKKGLYEVLKEFEYTDGIVYDGYDAVGSYSFNNCPFSIYSAPYIHTEYTGVIEYYTQPEVFDRLVKDGILED